MGIDLRRTESWRKYPISDNGTESKDDSRKMPMNATSLEERRFKCDLLITSGTRKLKEHRSLCLQ